MSEDRLYYINNNWYTYEQAHNLFGCTHIKPNTLTFYNSSNEAVTIRQDPSDNTLYDSANQRWVQDISDLNLYNKIGVITLYKSETPTTYNTYSDHLNSDTNEYIYYNDEYTLLDSLYTNYGITNYPCQSYYVENGNLLSWYDSNTELYWDNETKQWQDTAPEYGSDFSFIAQMNTMDYGETFDSMSMVYIPTVQIFTMNGMDEIEESI